MLKVKKLLENIVCTWQDAPVYPGWQLQTWPVASMDWHWPLLQSTGAGLLQ